MEEVEGRGAPDASDRPLGGVGTRVLFDNDRVRIWELDLAPGESSAVHQHTVDHVLVQLEGDRVAVVPEPDSSGPFRDYMEASVNAGQTVFVERGGIETAKNVGTLRYREIIIELK